MLRDALRAVGRADDAVGTAVVGGVLLLVTVPLLAAWGVFAVAFPPALVLAPLALAPALILRGYYLRVVAAGIDGGGAPSFVGWGRLYRDGLKSVLLSIGYLLPLVALAALGGLAAAFVRAGRVDLPGQGQAALGVAAAFLAVLAVAYLVCYAYLRPAALSVFAATGRLRDAFKPRRVGAVALDGDFAAGWLLAMFVLLAGLSLALPFVPLLAGVFAVFLVRVVAHSLYGRGAAATLGPVREPPAEDEAEEPAEPESGEPAEPELGEPAEPEPDGEPDDAVEAPPEPAPPVQVGRSVPLTATDLLSAATRREASTTRSDGRADREDRGRTADGTGFVWDDDADARDDDAGDDGR